MALSPFPVNHQTFPASSHFLYYLILPTQTHFLYNGFRALKFRPRCYPDQAIKVDVEISRKKRKPRPSFLDQIKDKWSVKPIISTRQKFPWQEKEEIDGGGEEDEEVKIEQSFGATISESESHKDPQVEVSDPVSFSLPSRVISAPWSHGTKSDEPHFNFAPERSNFESKIGDNFASKKRIQFPGGKKVEVVRDQIKKLELEHFDEGTKFNKQQTKLPLDKEVAKPKLLGKGAKFSKLQTELPLDKEVAQPELLVKGAKFNKQQTELPLDKEAAKPELLDEGAKFNKQQTKLPLDKEVAKPKLLDKGAKFNKQQTELPLDKEVAKPELLDKGAKFIKQQTELPLDKAVAKPELLDEGAKFYKQQTKLPLDKEVASVEGLNGVVSSRENFEVSTSGDKGDSVEGDSRRNNKRSNTEMAERMIPEHELRRLRNVALRMVERTKVGVAGITQALVEHIHDRWKLNEVVKLKFEEPLSLNMKRTHEILEKRTGGLVIWRSGGSVVLYRGISYNLHCVQSYFRQNQADINALDCSNNVKTDTAQSTVIKDFVRNMESFMPSSEYLKDLSKEELMDLCELNHLLDELGPRYTDWSGREPLPVDADLLPPVVPGYQPPFRRLPYGVRHCLKDSEMTTFRRLARRVPPHFALGRNRELQGLAQAIVKLWERSAIAKIALKRGVQNTRNERMAEELKQLTGGTLLSRNKDFIVFYRGNDFLPPVVTKTLKEWQKSRNLQQEEEEKARDSALALVRSNSKASKLPLVAGTLAETNAATSRWGHLPSQDEVEEMKRNSALAQQASVVRYLEKKLAHAKGKLKKADKALAKVQEHLEPAELPTDLETLSNEERMLFRKIGLSMKPYLLLGKRSVYDGTIENMHLHWKYRELVKIIVKRESLAQVKHIAISLEAESGGVLVSLDKTTKGYAIIIYRGKNYMRPRALRPKNLLTRRQALARSVELQRREALKHHVLDLQEKIESMKSELEEMKAGKEINVLKTSYSRLNEASLSDEDVEEDKWEEEYLETYDDSGDEDGYEEK